jgi:TonB family protein
MLAVRIDSLILFSLGLMRALLLMCFVLVFDTAAANYPSTPVVALSFAEAASMAEHSPLPEYPFEARRDRITGSGVFMMDVDIPTGRVLRVTVERTTGSRVLDGAALSAFRQWRFKPQKLRSHQLRYAPWEKEREMGMRVPVTFVLRET